MLGLAVGLPGRDEVHLWLLPLDCPPGGLGALLDAGERKRAERFRFPHDQARFATGRGLLRSLLGGYLGIAPQLLRFRYGAHGKPALASPGCAPPLSFNLSHSGGWALLGVTLGGEIGVDVEQLRDIPDHAELARQNFGAGEVAALDRLPPGRRQEGFFACWTRKEAYLKALGGGLTVALDQFDVSVDPDAPAALLASRGAAAAGGPWRLWSGRPLPGFQAAVAVRGVDALRVRPLRLGDAALPGAAATSQAMRI